MNVLIAKTVAECEQWTDVAVVVDVLRTGTTLCELAKRGKKEILVFADVQQAAAFAQTHGDFEVFCPGDFPAPHADNSPYLASKSNARRPAMLCSEEGGKALLRGAGKASLVLTGGFCNFNSLAEAIVAQEKDVLLIPASLYSTADAVEDGLCVAALKDYVQGVGHPQDAIVEYNNTMRCVEFWKQGPKTAAKDAKIAFKLDSVPVVPQVTFSPNGYGVCHLYGTPAPAQWLGVQPAPAAEPAPQAPSRPADEAPAAAQTEAEPVQSPVSAQPTDGKLSAPTRLKNFFNGILQVVKEEKEELQREISAAVPAAPKVAAPQSDDLLDAVLKKSEAAKPAAAVQTPSVKLASEETAPSSKPQDSGEVSFSQAPKGFSEKKAKKAIVLFSGGLDSTTCLYWALAHGYTCEALTVSYGQRHEREVLSAQMIARNLGVKHHLITLNLPWLSCCSLVDKNQQLPDVAVEDIPKEGIPSTYVPGRNLMFLSVAGSLLDAVGADAIIAGPNAVDFSGYPDCTPAFFKAAAEALNRGTKRGVSEGIEVLAPLMRLSKAEIVKLAASLKVPFELTWSCYAGGKKPCGHCDSCKLRAKGFEEAGVHDTALD